MLHLTRGIVFRIVLQLFSRDQQKFGQFGPPNDELDRHSTSRVGGAIQLVDNLDKTNLPRRLYPLLFWVRDKMGLRAGIRALIQKGPA